MRLLLVALVCFPGIARADGDDRPGDKPWAVGVSAADRAQALASFETGNSDYVESRYAAAVGHYTAALDYWDHPNIRYNLAVCLIHLDRKLEAFDHLGAAMRYGDAPLGRELHAQGQTYLRLLRGQLGFLEILVSSADTSVTLDGKPIATAPGAAASHVLLPGSHQLVATRPGHVTVTRTIELRGGETAPIELAADVSLSSAAPMEPVVEKRFGTAWPWITLAAGVALVGAGVPLQLAANDNFQEYDDQVADICAAGPCQESDLPRPVRELEDRGRLQSRLALASFGAGAIAVAAGIAMAMFNRKVTPGSGPEVALEPRTKTLRLGWAARF